MGIASAISKPGACARRHLQAIRLLLFVVIAVADRLLLCTKPPRPCAPSCWLAPRSPPEGACVQCQIGQPRTQSRSLFGSLQQHRMRSLHEELSQVFVPAPAGTSQLLLASGGVLARNHPQPGCKSAALLEGSPVADGCDCSRGSDRTDAGDSDQAPAWFKFAGRCARSACRIPRSARADTASPTAVVSAVPAMRPTACCPGLPGCRVETLQYDGVPCGW